MVPRPLPPGAGWSARSRVRCLPVTVDQKALSCPSSFGAALPFSKPRSWFFGPSGELQVEAVLLEEVLTAATAGQDGEEGVVEPTG